jgi:hypothetical protein
MIISPLESFGAGRGGRTPTRLPSADFESAASASSAIPAWCFSLRQRWRSAMAKIALEAAMRQPNPITFRLKKYLTGFR